MAQKRFCWGKFSGGQLNNPIADFHFPSPQIKRYIANFKYRLI
jgi:hypothetical protein